VAPDLGTDHVSDVTQYQQLVVEPQYQQRVAAYRHPRRKLAALDTHHHPTPAAAEAVAQQVVAQQAVAQQVVAQQAVAQQVVAQQAVAQQVVAQQAVAQQAVPEVPGPCCCCSRAVPYCVVLRRRMMGSFCCLPLIVILAHTVRCRSDWAIDCSDPTPQTVYTDQLAGGMHGGVTVSSAGPNAHYATNLCGAQRPARIGLIRIPLCQSLDHVNWICSGSDCTGNQSYL
jgi:hypothetical protein